MKFHQNEPPLWRNYNYLLLQSGQIVSFIGNQQQFIALPLFVLALTGSVVQAGLAIGFNAVATLVVSPIAGDSALSANWSALLLGLWLLILAIATTLNRQVRYASHPNPAPPL